MSFDIEKHKFPKVTGLDMAFSTFPTDKVLLKEAEKRGFYNGNTKWNVLASQLFFVGGKINLKKDMSDNMVAAYHYMKAFMGSWKAFMGSRKAFMGSWKPQHEEKEAIVALLLSELTV